MTVVNPKSISGINSITTGSGSDNLLTIHTSDANNTERVRVNSSGDVIIGSGVTLSPDGDIFATGITTVSENVKVGTGITLSPDGDIFATGITTISKTGGNGELIVERSGGAGLQVQAQSALGVFGTTSSHDLRLISNGNGMMLISTNGNVTLNSGNLVIGTAGKGIDFSAQTATSATGASATSEILDHYEEGTWTPTLTTSNGGSYSSSAVTGHYTRIGRMVHAHFQFNTYGNQGTDLTGSGSSSDNVIGGGLPFPTASGSQEYYQGDIGFYALNFPSSLSTGTLHLYAYQAANSSQFIFFLPRDNADSQQIQVGQFGQGYIRGCLHYLTSY